MQFLKISDLQIYIRLKIHFIPHEVSALNNIYWLLKKMDAEIYIIEMPIYIQISTFPPYNITPPYP